MREAIAESMCGMKKHSLNGTLEYHSGSVFYEVCFRSEGKTKTEENQKIRSARTIIAGREMRENSVLRQTVSTAYT